MIKQLLNGLERHNVHISSKQYKQFKKEYTMIGLSGEDFANAFCRYFKIVDYILASKKNDHTLAEEYIVKTYINKTIRNVIVYQ
jgi:hypothetical protein